MKDGTIDFTGRQIAAARILIGMRQEELAEAAGISAPTLRRMELTDGVPGGIKNNLLAIERALEQAGVIFVPACAAGGAGVRLEKSESVAERVVRRPERVRKRDANKKVKDRHVKAKR